MFTHGSEDTTWSIWRTALVALLAAALFAKFASTAQSQDPAPRAPLPLGVPPEAHRPAAMRLPLVPYLAPRPAEGAVPEQQWPAPGGQRQAPTALFLEPLKGNDAVIEVVVGQARLLTLRADLAGPRKSGVVAVGDPTVVDFEVMPNPRVLRLIGRRAGVTDLSLTTADDQTCSFEVHVGYDLTLLSAQLQQLFPDTRLRLFQIREHLAVEGDARSINQVQTIIQTVEAFLASVQVPQSTEGTDKGRSAQPAPAHRGPRETSGTPADGQPKSNAEPAAGQTPPAMGGEAVPEAGSRPSTQATFATPRIINLLRVPGVHQVMLQVRIAELNRTSLREIGANLFYKDSAGRTLGTKIGGAGIPTLGGLLLGGSETAFGIFPSTTLDVMLRALRENNVVSILAEPNLVAMSGQHADFLAGGEFPVPVPQNSGGGTTITVEFKKFGVQLDFLPYVLEDETIRLTVRPEESSIDFTLGTEINGYRIPGLNTRRASTTVELRQGQTLGIAGLLRMTIEGRTRRIPGLGDLPYIGPMFSNTSSQRTEKELLVLVTPHLVAPLNADQVPPLPGAEINEPNDLEFYLLNRIEGRTGRPFDSTRSWNDPWDLVRRMRLEQRCVCGPAGFSPSE